MLKWWAVDMDEKLITQIKIYFFSVQSSVTCPEQLLLRSTLQGQSLALRKWPISKEEESLIEKNRILAHTY